MTIEDYLDLVAAGCIDVPAGDVKLVNSLHTQTRRGQALTIRQHELLKRKLLEYKPLLIKKYPEYEEDLDLLRRPYREIDRSKVVGIGWKETLSLRLGIEPHGKPVITIRFPYSNRMVKHIKYIKQSTQWNGYEAKTKTHSVVFSDSNVHKIVSYFKDLNFTIEDRLLDYYNELEKFNNNYTDYQPGIYDYTIKNVNERCKASAIEKLGPPTVENLYLYQDNKDEFGLSYFDPDALNLSKMNIHPLTNSIINRTTKHVYIPSTKYTYHDIVQALKELNRMPLLVITGHRTQISRSMHQDVAPQSTDVDLLSSFHIVVSNIIGPVKTSVLYRKEKRDLFDIDFNAYISDNNLNTPLDDNPDIVFINQTKRVPKPLVESKWMPKAVLEIGASYSMNKSVQHFANFSPLILSYDSINLKTNRETYHA